MTIAFLDSNALLKMYLSEKGSLWVRNYARHVQIAISELALFETTTVIWRFMVENHYTEVETLALLDQITLDTTKFSVVPLGGQDQLDQLKIILFSLPTKLRIRSLDSIQLTAATIAKEAADGLTPTEPFVFVSSDVQLLRVAQAQNFVTENPEDHP